MKNLKEAFKSRKDWHNNRSSSIFPCFASKNTTHFIVFQNYWLWKNNIKNNELICIIRTFSSQSINEIDIKEFKISEHNVINLNYEFNLFCTNNKEKNNITSFEIEFISTKNIGFPFPGILFFCQDNLSGEITCVHSGGRRLNSNENITLKKYTESNWLVQENKIFTSFFHIFNDSIERNSENKIEISINVSGAPEKKFSKTINHISSRNASKIYYINEIFPLETINKIKNKPVWIEVSFYSYAFPRMIVGNYDKEKDFHYITHSFGKIYSKDYVDPEIKGGITSTLPLINVFPLNLKANSYPTNCPSTIEVEVFDYPPGLTKNYIVDSLSLNTKGDSIISFENNQTSLKLYQVKNKCPSRINVSYNYSLQNSRHPTDIATGFKSISYPLKESHWGHGICQNDFQTIIFIRNTPHKKFDKTDKPLEIVIEIFNEDVQIKKNISIPISGWNYLVINEEVFSSQNLKFFSWRFKDIKSYRMDTFWISYNKKTGAICGEHGF